MVYLPASRSALSTTPAASKDLWASAGPAFRPPPLVLEGKCRDWGRREPGCAHCGLGSSSWLPAGLCMGLLPEEICSGATPKL